MPRRCPFCGCEECECQETSERRSKGPISLVASLACARGNGVETTNQMPPELSLAESVNRVDGGRVVADPDRPRAVVIGKRGIYLLLDRIPPASVEVQRYTGEDYTPFSSVIEVLAEDFGDVQVGILDGDLVFAVEGGMVVCAERIDDIGNEVLTKTARRAAGAGLFPINAIPNGIEPCPVVVDV